MKRLRCQMKFWVFAVILFDVGHRHEEKIEHSLWNDNHFLKTLRNNFHDWGFRLSIDHYQPPKFKNTNISYSLGYSKSNIVNKKKLFIHFKFPLSVNC